MKRRLTALLLVLICLPLTACQKQQNLYSATWFDLFDTVAIVQGYADSQDSWNAQTQAMYSDLQRYNELFDIYHHYDGVINLYDVNARAAAAPVQVSDELYAFLRWCKDTAYPAANGATNIAAGAVLRLWHDARESDSPVPPDADAIAAALAHIDVEDLVLDDAAQTVYFADPEMALDVGAVGKGYAVEQTARAAQARGLTSALLNIGGNVRAIGTKPGGKPWTAGVENPWGDDPAYIQAVELADGDSLVISGDYQRYFEYDGVRYAHLIDLTTGYPARYVSSVAVLARADTGGLADALSTGLFCLPEETGQALAAQNHYAVLWMRPDETERRLAAIKTTPRLPEIGGYIFAVNLYKLYNSHRCGLMIVRQSRSPCSKPWMRTSAVAMFVATGTLCTSQMRSRFISFGSLGLALMGSRKKSSMSTSSQAMRATICSAPPWPPGRNFVTFSPAFSSTRRPVVPVASRRCCSKIWRYAIQNCTINSFLESWAINAIVIGKCHHPSQQSTIY